jgi:hypothetical protein
VTLVTQMSRDFFTTTVLYGSVSALSTHILGRLLTRSKTSRQYRVRVPAAARIGLPICFGLVGGLIAGSLSLSKHLDRLINELPITPLTRRVRAAVGVSPNTNSTTATDVASTK